MKKQRKQLIGMIVLLLLILAGYWGTIKYNEAQSNKAAEAINYVVENVASTDVTELSYVYEDVTYHYVKEEDTWKSSEDKELTLKQTRLENMVSKILSMEVVSQLDSVSDLSGYGFEEPSNILTIVANGCTYKITIGDKNAVTGYYYVSLDDSSIVYMVESTAVTGFNYSLEELIEEPEETEAPEEEAEEEGAETEGTEEESAGTETEGAETEGTEAEDTGTEGTETEGTEAEGAGVEGTEAEGTEAKGTESEASEADVTE